MGCVTGLFDTSDLANTTLLKDPNIVLKDDNKIIDEFVLELEKLMGNKLTIIRGKEEIKFKKVENFDMLSEGYKTTIIWLCDLLSRLIENYKEMKVEITKLEDFKAIVLIDEVDLYLRLVTILGAIEKAIFYKIYKDDKGNTQISEQIDDILYYTADILMSSPLFNVQSVTVRNFKDKLSNDDYVYHRIHKKIKNKTRLYPVSDTLKKIYKNRTFRRFKCLKVAI